MDGVDTRQLRMDEVQSKRALAMMCDVVPIAATRADVSVSRLFRVLPNMPQGLRTAAHAICLLRRFASKLGGQFCARMAPQTWTVAMMVTVILADKMTDDCETDMTEWRRALEVDEEHLSKSEMRVLEVIGWDAMVQANELRVVAGQIVAGPPSSQTGTKT